MLRVEASETRARDDVVRESYERIRDEFAGRIAAAVGSESNPDGLPAGLTISDDGALLNWRGENYVKQSTLGSGTLTVEQVREAVMSADRWEKPMGNTGLTNTHLIIRDDGWQAIADELNSELGSDDEYEAKMDALLCRLTNGKWSKSHAYSLDFMVSCVDEEYEELYEKERAELGNVASMMAHTRKSPTS